MLPLSSFTAIDFETAQGPRWSICQVGLIRVEKKKVVERIELLVQPPGNEYSGFNIRIHGITPQMTAKAPTFNKVWPKIKSFIEDQDVVAHNMAFDNSCLVRTLEYYRLKPPVFNQHCTYKLYGTKLSECCSEYDIELDHHNALSDANACAQLFLLHLKQSRVTR